MSHHVSESIAQTLLEFRVPKIQLTRLPIGSVILCPMVNVRYDYQIVPAEEKRKNS